MRTFIDLNDNYDEIEFLESELIDDDADAPVGALIYNDHGKVSLSAPAPVQTVAPAAAREEVPAPAPVEETPAAEEVTAPVEEIPAAEEPVAEQSEEAPAPAAEEQPFFGESPSPEEIAAYAIVYNPERAEATVNAAMEQETPAEQPVAAAEEAPAPVAEEPAAEQPAEEEAPLAPAGEETAPAESAAEQVEETPAPAAEQPAEAAAPEPAPKKKATPKKKAATVTIQKAASGDDIWGSAVIAPKKSEAKSDASDPWGSAVIKTEKKKTPAKASADDKQAPAADAADTAKEGTTVAKKEEKPAAKKTATKAAPAKKDEKPAKAAAKPAEEKAAAKKPAAKTAETKPAAKKTTAKAAPAKEEKAAKPATTPAEPAEQIIEEGDASAPHGRFVIKKTENGNFVYKLYSSNHRVVAIGAGLYTSVASCKSGINSVRNNAESAPIEDQTLQKWEEKKFPKWQIYFDKKGEVRLRLLASNGNIVATTNDGYLSRDAAKKGIEAIARASKGSAIVRNDNLW